MDLKFRHFFCYRVFSAFFIQTYFNPDEYYQSMEVAHRMAFGYGVITWEWKYGLRTYVYPLLISIPYEILRYLEWDSQYAVIVVPRVIHAIFTAFAEYRFYRTADKYFGRSSANWSAFLIMVNYFIFYLGARTLTNTLEMGFLLIILSMYPYRIETGKKHWPYLFVCTIAFFIRCTSAIAFIPLGLFHIFRDFGNFLNTLKVALPASMCVVVFFTAVDSHFLNNFVFAPYMFFKVNVWDQGSSMFGTEAFTFFFERTIPYVLTTTLPFFVWSLVTILSLRGQKSAEKTAMQIIASVFAFSVLMTSLNPHKEDRFILPVIPLGIFLAGVKVAKWCAYVSEKMSPMLRKFLIVWFITTTILVNGLEIFNKCLYHEYGRHHIVRAFTDTIEQDVPEDVRPSVLFLGECFGYPLSCAMHREDVQTRYVSCTDQMEFFKSPTMWFYRYFKQLGKASDGITHLIFTESHFIYNMDRVLYATGFTGDITFVPNEIYNYKYGRHADSIVIRRDFSEKQSWWYLNETSQKWVFNLTYPPEWWYEMNKTTVTTLSTETSSDNGTLENGEAEKGESSRGVNENTNVPAESVGEASEIRKGR